MSLQTITSIYHGKECELCKNVNIDAEILWTVSRVDKYGNNIDLLIGKKMKSNRAGFDFDKNGEINESKEALGLNKHIQKKFSSKREDAVEEVGKVIWYNASDFADAIRDRLKNDEISKHFDLIVSEEAPKNAGGNHWINIYTDFYTLLCAVIFDYKKDKPMFYAVYSLGKVSYFKGKKAIESTANKYFGWEYSKYEANSEEVDLLVKDIDRLLREEFPENDLFIGEKSKAIDESASLGLNKHVQKKFQDVDAIENINDYVDLGLPSGTLWCRHNYGVEKEYEYGDLYSFKEAQSLGISLPTKDDFIELRKNCTHKPTSVNGVNGMLFTSKSNGETVFFPAAGFQFYKSVSSCGDEGRYWSSEELKDDSFSYSTDGYAMVFDTHVNPSGAYLKSIAYSLREVQKSMRESSSLGLNKHIQKKFNDSNPEGMTEEIGNLIYMRAQDFFDGLQRLIDKDPVCSRFGLKIRDIERKSYYQVNAVINNDEYEEIAVIKVLETSKIADNPLFLLTFNGKYPTRFKGKNPILSTHKTTTWWNTNAEETEALVKFLGEKIKKNFPNKVNETSLGLNKKVQKKFGENTEESIENLNIIDEDLFVGLCIEEFSKSPYLETVEDGSKNRYRWIIMKPEEKYRVDIVRGKSGVSSQIFIKIFNGDDPKKAYFEINTFMYVFKDDEYDTPGQNPYVSSSQNPGYYEFKFKGDMSFAEIKKASTRLDEFFKRSSEFLSESSLGLNKHIQKKFEEKDVETVADELGALDVQSFEAFVIKYLDGAIIDGNFTVKYRATFEDEKAFNGTPGIIDYVKIDRISFDVYDSDGKEIPDSLNVYVDKENDMFDLKCDSLPGWEFQYHFLLDRNTNPSLSVQSLEDRIGKRIERHVNETSLGLNKHIQKKFEDQTTEDKAVEIGSLPLSKEDFKERVIEEINKEFDKIGHEHFSLKAWFRPSTWREDEYVDIRYIDDNNYHAVARICIKNDSLKKEQSFFAVWQDDNWKTVHMTSQDDPVDFINGTDISSHDFATPQFSLTHNSVNAFIDWLVNKSGFPLFNKEVNEGKKSLGLNKHVQKKFEDKKSEDITEDIDIMSIDEFETKFIEEINSLEIRQAPLVKFHAVKRELDKIVIETTYPGKLSSALLDSTPTSNGQLELYVDEDDGSIVFSFWCCNSLSSISNRYKSEWFGRKNKGNFYHKMCYKNLFKAISFARDFFTRHHDELYSDIDESSLGLNKHVQKRYEEQDPVDTEGLDIMKDPSAFMFAIQRYVQKKYSDVFTKFNLNDNIAKFKGELVDAKILTMYDNRFDPYSRFSPHVIVTIDKKKLKFSVYVAMENRGILYDDGSEWHDLSLSIMRELLEWAVKVFTGEIHESSLGLNKKVQKQYASKDIDNAIDMVSVSPLAVPVLFSDGHVDIKYLSCISTKEDSDDVIIKEKKSIIKRLVKHEGFTLLDGGKSVDDYVLTDEIIRGQRHMYRFRFVMTPSMHDRGLCGVDQNDSEGGIALLPVDYIVKTHDDLEFSKLLLDKFGVSNPQLVYQGNVSIYQKKDDEYKDIIIAQVDELQPRPAGKVYHSYYCTLRL